eukprot:CAMPEP_0182469460 /NCGR_PEP_ID=MMETSP1319-20130603/17120_1 /TAXON_ID=172717 /ORGANISM="Bolidomonas pacifica, Strain RCC208" /LENGTH=216 /DNA_ID=CAMNT_0024669769 /DNA_START=211 /DNA_END=857 /DNA_ORIENTATION=-
MSSNSASNSAYAASLVAATALAKTLSSPLPPLPPPSSYDGHVYEPSDDTYLMVDAIAHHLSTSSSSPTKVLEIGTGSGCNIVKAAQCLEGKGEFMATDINPKAIEAAMALWKATFDGSSSPPPTLQTFESDLLAGQSELDLLIFNPPYVPTPSSEISGSGIEVSWAGGVDGREVIDRALPIIKAGVAEGGVVLMILVDENKPEEVIKMWGKGEVLV